MGIPASDYYRSVKALEGKSDAERRRLVWQATLKRGDAIWVIPGLVAIVAAAAWIGIGWQLMVIVNAAAGGIGPAPAPPAGAPAAPATPSIPTPLKTILFGLSVIVFLAAWVTTRRVMILHTLRRLINRAACPSCEFCLIGLKMQGAYVTCPECGERIDLYKEGIRPEDLELAESRHKPFEGAGRFGAYKVPESAKQPTTRPSGRPAARK